jgi:hypothetical protein
MDLHNILYLLNQNYSFRHYAIWEYTFKQLNIEL